MHSEAAPRADGAGTAAVAAEASRAGRDASNALSIKAVFVNLEGSTARQRCMEEQLGELARGLAPLGVRLEVERYPGVTFGSCTGSVSCTLERPSCLKGKSFSEFYHKGGDRVAAWKGAVGNWCAHYELLAKLKEQQADWDYFFILEDDVVFLQGFAQKLASFLRSHPAFWSLVVVDAFNMIMEATGEQRPSPAGDLIEKDGDTELWSISTDCCSYFGGQAWLVSSAHLPEVYDLFDRGPVVPLDEVPKLNRSLHTATWAFQAQGAMQLRFVPEGYSPSEVCKAQSLESEISRGSAIADDATAHADASSLVEKVGRYHREGEVQTEDAPRELVFLGMQRSGVEYVTQLARSILDVPAPAPSSCSSSDAAPGCGRVWPQTHPDRLAEAAALYDCAGACRSLAESVAVVVVRHPESALRSLQAASRRLDVACGNLSAADWLEKGCVYAPANSTAAGRVSKAACGTLQGPCWESLPEAWSSYARGYLNMKPGDVFHDVVMVRYEDLVQNPLPSLRRIAAASGRPAPRGAAPEGRASEAEVRRRGRALAKLASSDYEANYLPEEYTQLCARIDKPTLFKLGYRGCQAVSSMKIHYWYYPDFVGDTIKAMRGEDVTQELLDEAQAGAFD